MNIELNHVQQWLELAKQVNWSVSRMAKCCNTSPRTLERYFLEHFKTAPKSWLIAQRQQLGRELLQKSNASVKEVAVLLGYKKPHHFSQEFKKLWGVCPVQFSAKKNRSRVFV